MSVTCDRWVVFSVYISSTNKIDHHDITEILFKVGSNTINTQTHLLLLLVIMKYICCIFTFKIITCIVGGGVKNYVNDNVIVWYSSLLERPIFALANWFFFYPQKKITLEFSVWYKGYSIISSGKGRERTDPWLTF